MHDIRTVKRHIRAGRTSPEALETFLADLPDASENILPPEEGGDSDGFDDIGKEAAPAESETAPAPAPAPEVSAPPVPAAASPAPPTPMGTPFSADFDPAAHLAHDPMMPPPQPIPGFGGADLGAPPVPSTPAPSVPAPEAPAPSAPVPSAPAPSSDTE